MKSSPAQSSGKFTVAFKGVMWAMRSERSFWVHLPVTGVVIALGLWLKIDPSQWSLVVIATTMVIVSELFNTAIESLAHAVHPEQDPGVGRALDIAAGAVLVASLGAVVIGLLVFVNPLWQRLFG